MDPAEVQTFNDRIDNAQAGLDFAKNKVAEADALWIQLNTDAPYLDDEDFEQGSETLESIISKYNGAKSAATWALNLIHLILWDLMGDVL